MFSDMGYITINLKTCYSTTIINYGPWNTEITIKKLEKKQLENSGILVQFEKAMLSVGKTTYLTITWQPTSAKYTGRSTREQHPIYLEVNLNFYILPLKIKLSSIKISFCIFKNCSDIFYFSNLSIKIINNHNML